MSGRRIDSRVLRKLPRPHPNPNVERHLQMFYRNEGMVSNIFSFDIHYANFTDAEMDKLGIIVGPRLEVDGEPMDLANQFFVPSSRDHVEKIVQKASETGDCIWPRMGFQSTSTIERRRNVPDDEMWRHGIGNTIHASEVQVVLHRLICEERQGFWVAFGGRLDRDVLRHVHGGGCHGHVPGKKGEETEIHLRCDLNRFGFLKRDRFGRTPSPHVLIEFGQTQAPPDDRPTRSDIHMASNVLRYMMLNRHWLDHHTLPVLMLSYHGHGCRIVQACLTRRGMEVRVSRMLNLTRHRGGTITDDAHIALQWLLSTPAGRTRSGHKRSRDKLDVGSVDQRFPRPTASLGAVEGVSG